MAQTAAIPLRDTGPLARFLGVQQGTLIPVILTGLMVSLIIVVAALSYPALAFTGALAPYAGIAVLMGLVSASVLTLAQVAFGSFPGSVCVGQAEPAVILGLAASTVAASIAETARPEQLLPTFLALVLVSSVATGAVFGVLGIFRLGNIVRFVPYPVVVGFLGGIGWLMLEGTIGVLTGHHVSLAQIPALLVPLELAHWLPALILAAVLFALAKVRPGTGNVPAMVLVCVAGFWLSALALGADAESLAVGGWLIEVGANASGWSPAGILGVLGAADWSIVLAHWPTLLTIVLVNLVTLLIQASSIEIAAERDVDLNKELRAAGLGNVICGALGSMPGFHSLSGSRMAIRMGHPVRLVGLMAAAVCIALMIAGTGLIALLPRLLIGMLVFYIGLGLIADAVWDRRLRSAPAEYFVSLVVFATVAFVGMIEGLGIGIVTGVTAFVVKYTQIDVVRRMASGDGFQSNVDRSPRARDMLARLQGCILVLELQGYIFFGTSNSLLSRIRDRLDDSDLPSLRFIILDLRRVTGIDSSAVLSLSKLSQYSRARDFSIIVTAAAPRVLETLHNNGLHPETVDRLFVFPDLDHGLEHCEKALLGASDLSAGDDVDALRAQLRGCGGTTADIDALMTYVERRDWRQGEALIRQGDPSDDLYFVERGSVAVRLTLPDGGELRLRTMGAGNVVGELALYLNQPRTASVVADVDVSAARLTREAIHRMKDENPRAAVLFQEFIATILADKLVATNKLVQAASS